MQSENGILRSEINKLKLQNEEDRSNVERLRGAQQMTDRLIQQLSQLLDQLKQISSQLPSEKLITNDYQQRQNLIDFLSKRLQESDNNNKGSHVPCLSLELALRDIMALESCRSPAPIHLKSLINPSLHPIVSALKLFEPDADPWDAVGELLMHHKP